MNALITFPLRATIQVLWMDAAGVLPALKTNIPCSDIARWRRFGPAKLMELLKAIHLDRVILWADWAEAPQDFRFLVPGIGEHVVLVRVEGERGSPLPYAYGGVEKYRARDEKRARRLDPQDVESSDPFERTSQRYWRSGNVGAVAVPEAVAPGPKCGCGIGHTLASYDALPMLSFSTRQEGFTVITDASRTCNCGAALHFTSTRLVGG